MDGLGIDIVRAVLILLAAFSAAILIRVCVVLAELKAVFAQRNIQLAENTKELRKVCELVVALGDIMNVGDPNDPHDGERHKFGPQRIDEWRPRQWNRKKREILRP